VSLTQRGVVHRLACYLLISLGALGSAGAARASTVDVTAPDPTLSALSADGCLTPTDAWQGTDQADERGDSLALLPLCLFPTSPADQGPSSSGTTPRGGSGRQTGGSSTGPLTGHFSTFTVSPPTTVTRFTPEDGACDLTSLSARTFRPPRAVR
jgi:hypothetical protein